LDKTSIISFKKVSTQDNLESNEQPTDVLNIITSETLPSTCYLATPRNATVQLYLKSQIDDINSDLVGLYNRQKQGLLSNEQNLELKDKQKRKTELEKKLKRKIDDQRRSQKARDLKKSKLNALLEDNPELRTKLNIRARCGQPKIEEEQPLLLQTILDIAM